MAAPHTIVIPFATADSRPSIRFALRRDGSPPDEISNPEYAVTVIIDSGATENYVSRGIADALKLDKGQPTSEPVHGVTGEEKMFKTTMHADIIVAGTRRIHIGCVGTLVPKSKSKGKNKYLAVCGVKSGLFEMFKVAIDCRNRQVILEAY